ncbi:hypothetical protein BAUCODRAFT_469937 [Baudoinia panamericana UAMH 10762]|uniref:Major facilitator superfamily (MFS) profile domain-containing protein n=1 Tax=Baudoinia panamericana (strain UAMH 10762) TaxID=717646 RepID=M2MI16_BAUPA|nr:uncharacterized protein BAUCODRAFT_469937 [Baudoinia panamericana UAMH 10762]EMC96291.1 hypothetical protein BAUCODRAFT_469937 [Baudoinia panamericana UAMH 10762]
MGKIHWYYYFALCVIACAGIPKGYDEGGFSASTGLQSFKNDFNLNTSHWKHNPSGLASRKANISSFGVLGAAFGSIIALLLNDRIGRLRTFQSAICIWATGILMQIFASGIYGFMLFARIWGGLGAGALTVTAPLFLSEIAPAKNRGLVVSLYMVVLLSFLTLGFFVNYAANAHMKVTRLQYRIVQAVPLIPTGLALICSFWMTDTPRWLASKDRHDEAVAALARLRGSSTADPAVAEELQVIEAQRRARVADLSATSLREVIREILTIPNYRSRFFLVMTMQTVAQWSGGNGITYYIPQIFNYAGITGSNASLISSGCYGIVKLVFTMVFAWGLIDVIGRRRCFLTGLALQLAAHIYMAAYMGVDGSAHNKSASDAAIASIFIYAVGWSIGLCTVQYLYGTEVFPTRIRSVSYASSMCLHWFFQFAVVRVTPNMFVSLNVWGAYIFWAVICALGLVILGLWAPETKGVPMERMGELFEGPWWMCWRNKVSAEPFDPVGETEKIADKEPYVHVERV